MDDVCLILEGTYPYVSGGVSSWVYQLVKNLRDTTFSIVFLGASRKTNKKLNYELPSNVRDFREYYLFDYRINKDQTLKPSKSDYEALAQFFILQAKGDPSSFGEILKIVGDKKSRSISMFNLAHGHKTWKILKQMYEREMKEVSFLDFFWTWRFLYLPLFSLMRIELPPARVYHAPSTGYAGVVGAMAKLTFNRPFLLTEHGIYTRERKIEISTSDWIYSEEAQELKVLDRRDHFREWWIDMFSYFSRLAYSQADEIITLYEGNRKIQIEEGADPHRTKIIPNGIDVPKTMPIFDATPRERFRIGFVGRIVPIKDVKTLIRAITIVYSRVKEIEAWMLGPTDEDEDYFEECRALVIANGLEKIVHFKGKVKLSEYYPQLDVIVLTSISEGQPLVTLEGFAYKVPCVATDVGSCKELIEGASDEDKLFGPAGIVTSVCDPGATAAAILELIQNPDKQKKMGESGRNRALKYYQSEDMLARYQELYNHYTEEVRW